MEVTLKIEASQLGETVVDLFRNLGEDQRKEIAIDILKKWLDEPFHIEREAFVESVIREFRNSNLSLYIHYNRKTASECSDKEIKDSDEFKSRMKNFKSSREVMVNEITKEVITHFKSNIQEQIKVEPKFEELQKILYKFILDNFPMMIRESIISFFTANLSTIATNATTALNQSDWFNVQMDSLRQSLQNNYNINV